ncbi:hypothetical protein [Dactylosporangium cerinum]
MTGHDYPVVLAVEDFVPTLLAMYGFWLLASLGRVTPGRVGAVLIGAGGIAKSVWKLLVAGFDVDLPWLEGALFLSCPPAPSCSSGRCCPPRPGGRSPRCTPPWRAVPCSRAA